MGSPTESAAEASSSILGKIGASAQVAGPLVTVGSATKQYWGLSLDEWSFLGIVAGIGLGLLGYVTSQGVNFYFSWKQDRRRQAEYESRMTIGGILRADNLEHGDE